MRRVLSYVVLGCVGSWGLISLISTPRAAAAVFLGMVVPLLVAIGTIVPVRRIYLKEPVQLTSFMVKALMAKMLLFGVYVALVIGFFPVEPIPFVISFTFYFTALHLTEALYFRHLFRTT